MIRLATKSDIKKINEIGNSFNKEFSKLFNLESSLKNALNIIIVYEEENIIKGFLYAQNFDDNIDLLEIVVDTIYQKNNIGTRLINYLIDNYCFHNKTITLEVSVNNEKAIGLYKKLGFKVVNIRKKYYHNSDAYLMVLKSNYER